MRASHKACTSPGSEDERERERKRERERERERERFGVRELASSKVSCASLYNSSYNCRVGIASERLREMSWLLTV